jgi:hypothetical protein
VKDGNQRPRTVAEVRASLERSTQDLKAAIERLERGARAKLDIGRRVAGRASVVLVAGFVAGVLLGIATSRAYQPWACRGSRWSA